MTLIKKRSEKISENKNILKKSKKEKQNEKNKKFLQNCDENKKN
jgi:hypothetical protein